MKEDVVVERISNWEYSFCKSSRKGISVVANALTFRDPNIYANSRRYMFDKKNKTFKIGMLSNVIDLCDKLGVKYLVFDYEYSLPSGVKIDNRLTGNYKHQSQAVKAFFEHRFGIIVVPTRGGKTFTASEIFRIFIDTDDGKALFIVDAIDLFSQAVNDIKEYFETYGGITVGEIKEGKVDVDHDITVGMIQTIQSVLSTRCIDKVKKKTLQDFLKNLKFLCVDEIHDNCSDSRLAIYKKCKKLEYQLCLSATPYRSENFIQNLKLQAWSGGIIYTIKESTLRERSVLSDYKVFMLLLDHNSIDYDIDIEDYAEFRKKLIYESEIRNKIMFKVIEILKELELKTLIIFQGISHGKIVEAMTGIPFIFSETKAEQREKEKVKFLAGKGGFLLASNIYKKGITLPQVEVLINADGGLEQANTRQRKGRVIGTAYGKQKSAIIDFFDIFDCYFSEHSESRLNAYIADIGEDSVGLLDTSINDCLPTLKKWLIKWFDKDKDCSDIQ